VTGPADGALAAALRWAMWSMDDAAHDLPAGRLTAERCTELIDTFDLLAQLFRNRAQRCDGPDGGQAGGGM
jgi:hypothetical protein